MTQLRHTEAEAGHAFTAREIPIVEPALPPADLLAAAVLSVIAITSQSPPTLLVTANPTTSPALPSPPSPLADEANKLITPCLAVVLLSASLLLTVLLRRSRDGNRRREVHESMCHNIGRMAGSFHAWHGVSKQQSAQRIAKLGREAAGHFQQRQVRQAFGNLQRVAASGRAMSSVATREGDAFDLVSERKVRSGLGSWRAASVEDAFDSDERWRVSLSEDAPARESDSEGTKIDLSTAFCLAGDNEGEHVASVGGASAREAVIDEEVASLSLCDGIDVDASMLEPAAPTIPDPNLNEPPTRMLSRYDANVVDEAIDEAERRANAAEARASAADEAVERMRGEMKELTSQLHQSILVRLQSHTEMDEVPLNEDGASSRGKRYQHQQHALTPAVHMLEKLADKLSEKLDGLTAVGGSAGASPHKPPRSPASSLASATSRTLSLLRARKSKSRPESAVSARGRDGGGEGDLPKISTPKYFSSPSSSPSAQRSSSPPAHTAVSASSSAGVEADIGAGVGAPAAAMPMPSPAAPLPPLSSIQPPLPSPLPQPPSQPPSQPPPQPPSQPPSQPSQLPAWPPSQPPAQPPAQPPTHSTAPPPLLSALPLQALPPPPPAQPLSPPQSPCPCLARHSGTGADKLERDLPTYTTPTQATTAKLPMASTLSTTPPPPTSPKSQDKLDAQQVAGQVVGQVGRKASFPRSTAARMSRLLPRPELRRVQDDGRSPLGQRNTEGGRPLPLGKSATTSLVHNYYDLSV